MCGIAGFLAPSARDAGPELEAAVRRMADCLSHRGPDDAGAWVDPAAGFAMGHRRLSILDLSETGHQPMHSSCGRYVIALNGEIYNHRQLRRELAAKWRGTSDTEVLLAAISAWGLERTLERCNGMFAFALWDRKDRTLWLTRDRLGEKPLYYGRAQGTFVFASGMNALRAHPSLRPVIDRDALALYLRFGYVPAPHSIYQGIRKLEPGMLLRLRPGDSEPTLRRYWDPLLVARRCSAERFPGSDSEAVARLDELLRDAVKLRMEADVPLGAFLSGGIDSSTVVALMQAQSARPVKTFTIGFREADYDEAAQARAVARHLCTEHTELTVTPLEAMRVIPSLPTVYDEPFADSSQIPTALVSALARRDVTVSLSGDGGDELFGGYNRYSWGRSIWSAVGWLPTSLRGLLCSSLTAIPPALWDRAFRAAGGVLPKRFHQRTAGDRVHKLAGVLDSPSSDAFYDRLVSLWQEPAAVVRGGTEPRQALGGLPRDVSERMMIRDATGYLPDDILVKLDRAAMGVSLEARVPLLDPRVFEFAWSLPLKLKLRGGQGKWALRQVLYRYVPPALVERPKAGFGVPIGAWLRGELRPWAEDLLSEGRLQREGFFDPAPIRGLWQEHHSGRRNWQNQLWAVLMFQAWLDRGDI